MRNEDLTRLRHMIQSAEAALRVVGGRTRPDLETNEMLLFAVVRAVEVLGEAASKVTSGDAGRTRRHPLVSDRRHAQSVGARLVQHRP